MIEGFNKRLLDCIVLVSLLLACTVAVDYASNDTIVVSDNNSLDELNNKSITVVNSSYVLPKDSGWAKTDGKLYMEKKSVKEKSKKFPTVTITAKPSCGCNHKYRWYTRTWINYCPHCHKYGTLHNVHKWQARYEQELTCDPKLGGCGADYCGCSGKEKYSWSSYRLTKA